jgi:hypothetical protein
MSAILFIAKDVLAATWSIPAKRLMGIFLRLSIVVGVIMSGVALGEAYLRYNEFATNQIKESYRIHYALKCAQAYSDGALLRHANQYGNFDISKVGCSDKVFWANLGEVRNLPKEPPLSNVSFRDYLNLYDAAIIGIICMATVVVLGMLLVLVRRVANWVIGS